MPTTRPTPPQFRTRPRSTSAGRDLQLAQNIAGSAAQAMLLLIVALTPWLFGGVQATVQWVVCCAVLSALACWLFIIATDRRQPVLVPLASLPLLAAIVFGLFQTVPLPAAIAEVLSPVAHARWSAAYAGLGSASSAATPLSLYPGSTRSDVALLVLATAVFFLGTRFFSTRAAQAWLWVVLAVNGAALALFGIIQQLTWNGKLYWTVAPSQVTSAFGPYVNHNNAAGFLNMCLAGAVAVWLWQPRRSAGRIGLGLTLLITAGILCSLSRGAFVSMAAAALCVASALCRQRRSFKPLLAVFGAGAAIAVLLAVLGMAEAVQTRLATLATQTSQPNERIAHWRDALTAVPDFWLTGSGLGTYRYIYRFYEDGPGQEWFFHAENQYVEALVEGGLPGLLLLLLIILGTLDAVFFNLHNEHSQRGRAFALAALFALVTQFVHAAFDFGLYLPANMLLCALIAGSVIGRTQRWASARSLLTRGIRLHKRPAAIAVVVVLAVQCWLPLTDTASQAALDASVARWRELPETAPLPVREAALQSVASAAIQRWDDLDAQRRAAGCYRELFRLQVYQLLRKEHPYAAEEELWKRSAPEEFVRVAREWRRDGNLRAWRSLLQDPYVTTYLAPAYRHWQLALRASPLRPSLYVACADYATLFHTAETSGRLLQPMLTLGSNWPRECHRAGLIHLQAGRFDEAYQLWRISLSGSDEFLEPIIAHALETETPESVLRQVLPPSPQLLVRVMREFFPAEQFPETSGWLIRELAEAIAATQAETAEMRYLRAVLAQFQGRTPEALEHFAAALTREPSATQWRYEYAQLLRDDNQREAALREIRRCLQFDPTNGKYLRLLKELYDSSASAAVPPSVLFSDSLSVSPSTGSSGAGSSPNPPTNPR